MFFNSGDYSHLETVAKKLRLDILDMVYHAGTGHIGGSLSMIDIMVALYLSGIFDFDRDHFILSAGQACLAHYALLAHLNKFPRKLLSTYTDINSLLQGHESIDVPGVEYSSGCLGQGLSFAAGLALGDRDHHTVCITTDGEHNEGQIWEAVMFANKCNGIQIGGTTEDIMPLGDLAAKYLRFGWTVTTVDGHDYGELIRGLRKAKDSTIYPACIVAKTTLGKGISFMEGDYRYHDVKNLSSDLYLRAKNELK
jgi:transketolase